jgi:histidinol-phosphatase (PHP family)
LYFNFHTHTTYCDGQNTINELVVAAIEKKILQLGISSHAPLPVPAHWSLTDESAIEKYINDIETSRMTYGNTISVLKSLEADYIPGMTLPFAQIKNKWGLDYIIGSVHLVRVPSTNQVWFIDGKQTLFNEGIDKFFGGNGRKACLAYFRQIKEMIQTQEFDIIAHLDKIKLNNSGNFFNENDEWYIRETDEILRLIKAKDIILEINTRGFYQKKRDDFYPSDNIVKKAHEMGIRLLVNSDAHRCSELNSGMQEAIKLLKSMGHNKTLEYRNGQWIERPLTF